MKTPLSVKDSGAFYFQREQRPLIHPPNPLSTTPICHRRQNGRLGGFLRFANLHRRPNRLQQGHSHHLVKVTDRDEFQVLAHALRQLRDILGVFLGQQHGLDARPMGGDGL